MLIQTMQKSHDGGAPALSWLTFERRNWLALAFVVGAAGYGVGNGHTTQGAIQDVSQQLGQKKAEVHALQTVTIPKLKAANNCEANRGDKAAAVATQAIKSATIEAVPIPSPSAIPADNCQHPPPK